MNLEELKKPFPVGNIKWRIGQKNKDKTRAMMLCYIDARDVMDRLDEVCGLDWSDEYKEVSGRIVCTIRIGAYSRSDGAGDTDFEGEKGGLSDAFKRAAVKWGIGRYLYNAREYNTWVNCKDIPDYDVYNKNKEQLDKVARLLSGQEKTPAEKAKETREINKKSFEERFSNMYKYFKGQPKWSYELEGRFNSVMEEATKRNYDKEKCEEMLKIFEDLEKDSLPDFGGTK